MNQTVRVLNLKNKQTVIPPYPQQTTYSNTVGIFRRLKTAFYFYTKKGGLLQ